MPKADIGVTSLARASNAGGTVMLFFRHRSAEMDSLLHWIGVAVVLLIIAFGLVGFWRGLSLKPTDPASRPSEGFWRRSPWQWF
jgi:hypothetical protein